MLCDICHEGLEGMYDPLKSQRLGLYKEWFPSKQTSKTESEEATEPANEEEPDLEKYIFAHHKTRESFLRSQNLGCVQCNRFSHLDIDEHPHPVNDGAKIPQAEEAGYFSVFYVRWREEKPIMFVRYGDCIGGFSMVPVGVEKHDVNMTFELDPSTDSPKTWAMIDAWLTNCVENHEHCRQSSASDYLPSRLLTIDDSQKEATVRLITRTECKAGARYATLSHCWGTGNVENKPRLLKSTVNQFLKERPIDSLPKTFRDAMLIAVRLGIHYVWIDSLCIYQDSMEDWRSEAASMKDVYYHSYLNISALGANNDDEGCFFERDPAHVAPTVVQLRHADGQAWRPFRFELEKAWAWRLAWKSEPITRRAWVVQERLLPPRVLHFGRKQVFWECRERNACELHPDTVYCFQDDQEGIDMRRAAEAKQKGQLHIWKQLLDAPDRQYVQDPCDQLFVDWNDIIYVYTNSALTIPSDRLIALSGLANDMQDALQRMKAGSHKYLAGLWAERLEHQLCWFTRGEGQRPEKYRAPSWSWASVDGPAMMASSRGLAENVGFTKECFGETNPLGERDTGEVVDGLLTLAGPWVQVNFGGKPQDGNKFQESLRLHMQFKNLETEEVSSFEEGKLTTGQRFGPPHAIFDVKGEEPETGFCMPMIATLWAEEAYSATALILVRVEGDEELYRRVGVLMATWKSKEAVKDFFAQFPIRKIKVV